MEQMSVITAKNVSGHRVAWTNDGIVRFSRDFHDLLPDRFQGNCFRANTPREFDSVCRMLEAGINQQQAA